MQAMRDRALAYQKILSPMAVPTLGTLGRERPEPPDSSRTPFQRDRDRIIHAQAFRRLQGKTQVFVAGEGDHYRTRLTHTMEVAQIGRDIARTLALNEDLAECIALAHDLGHPPFGHAGETALDGWLQTHGKHFEHNEQSLRLITVLEQHTTHAPGLNLNQEVLEGLMKHRTIYDHSEQSLPERSPSLEAQIINLADEIAYTGHDCEDGLRAGLFTLDELCSVPLVSQVWQRLSHRGTALRGAIIHQLVTDLYETSERCLQQYGIRTLADVYAASTPLVEFSPSLQETLGALRSFLQTMMYRHPSITAKNREGQDIILGLCEAYYRHPPVKVVALQHQCGCDLPTAIKDYVSGMTDSYATAQWSLLQQLPQQEQDQAIPSVDRRAFHR